MSLAVRAIEPLDGFRLRVAFNDGVVTIVDLSDDLWGPMFEPLRDSDFFRQAQIGEGLIGGGIDPAGRTVAWPNGLDLAPEVLHGDAPPVPPSRMRVSRIEPRP